MKKGIVYLVGAGPGDPKLISLRGLECVRKADVVIFDRLANRQLLNEAKDGVEIIFAGKKRGDRSVEQPKINELMTLKANEGKIVARLKGGDGFIFGRGGEEAIYLKENGVAFEIIPGISSAYAVPAYAGIPVTHRGVSSSVAFITGHEDMTKKNSAINWEKLAIATDTIVFLMGMKNLEFIIGKLIKNGRAKNTPVAVIRWGTTPKQKTVIGTLETIVDSIKKSKIGPPATTIVGDVVNLRDQLNWFEKKPLFGKKIIVTRAARQAAGFSQKIEELGGYVIKFPTIKTVAVEAAGEIDSAIDKLKNGRYSFVVFTSANSVKYLFNRLKELSYDSRIFGKAKIAAIGKATAEHIKELNLIPDFIPSEFIAESAAGGLLKILKKGDRVLFPKAAETRAVIPDALRSAGVEIDEVIVYQTVPADKPSLQFIEILTADKPDYITFTSSSTFKNFVKLFEVADLAGFLNNIKIASIGPITSQTIKESGFKVDLEAKEYTVAGLLQAILEDINQKGDRLLF
jgi:uroporphyrinogen III methyltransferase/synthase